MTQLESISTSRAGVILCNKSVKQWLGQMQEQKRQQQCLVFLDNPRLVIMHIIKFSLQTGKKANYGEFHEVQ